MIKSPIGAAITAVGLLLALSPEARKTARKLAVKGTEMALDLSEHTKEAAAGLRKQLQEAVQDSRNPRSRQ